MKAKYLSHHIDNSTPSYGNRDKVIITPKSRIEDGETANTSSWNLTNNHIGTHVDVPKHFYINGRTITDLTPDFWFFKTISLIDIPCSDPVLISESDLRNNEIHVDTDLLIIRTGYQKYRNSEKYWNSYPGIAPQACTFLRENYLNLRGVGFDFISLTSPQFKDEGVLAHKILLEESNGDFILIIEDMNLKDVKDISSVVVSPLLVKNANGSPVTVIALNGSNE